MNVLILTNMAPFSADPLRKFAELLATQLRAQGHAAEALAIPSYRRLDHRLLDCILAFRLLELRNVDLLISLDFPSAFVKAENKIIWLFEKLYDDEGVDESGLGADATFVRDRLVASAAQSLAAAKRAFVASPLLRDHLSSLGLEAPALLPASLNAHELAALDWSKTVDKLIGLGR